MRWTVVGGEGQVKTDCNEYKIFKGSLVAGGRGSVVMQTHDLRVETEFFRDAADAVVLR